MYGGVGLAWCVAWAVVGDDGPAAALAAPPGRWGAARRRLARCALGRGEGAMILDGLAAERREKAAAEAEAGPPPATPGLVLLKRALKRRGVWAISAMWFSLNWSGYVMLVRFCRTTFFRSERAACAQLGITTARVLIPAECALRFL